MLVLANSAHEPYVRVLAQNTSGLNKKHIVSDVFFI
nr:MAG TPA: hypothetical protein [Caudoviricetes sp.]